MKGNWVKIPNGTAAVSAETMLVDESQSLGKPEKAEHVLMEKCLRKRKSENLLGVILFTKYGDSTFVCRKNGCINLVIDVSVFSILSYFGLNVGKV